MTETTQPCCLQANTKRIASPSGLAVFVIYGGITMEENKLICSHCEAIIDDDDYEDVDGQIVCADCVSRYTTTCERCGAVIWNTDVCGDDYTRLCCCCYENH